MGKKYIIEIIGGEEGDMDFSTIEPYTEPDLEQVRKEAYEQGLSDAWDAARKIGSNSMCSLEEMGFDFSQCAVDDYNPSWFVVKNYSASEAIEKIRQYEQKKEEQIQVGDEVIATSGKAVIVGINDDKDKARYIYPDSTLGFDNICNLSKTGRHFPEIAEVLAKMKETDNG